jgi:hypothetical protein
VLSIDVCRWASGAMYGEAVGPLCGTGDPTVGIDLES